MTEPVGNICVMAHPALAAPGYPAPPKEPKYTGTPHPIFRGLQTKEYRYRRALAKMQSCIETVTSVEAFILQVKKVRQILVSGIESIDADALKKRLKASPDDPHKFLFIHELSRKNNAYGEIFLFFLVIVFGGANYRFRGGPVGGHRRDASNVGVCAAAYRGPIRDVGERRHRQPSARVRRRLRPEICCGRNPARISERGQEIRRRV